MSRESRGFSLGNDNRQEELIGEDYRERAVDCLVNCKIGKDGNLNSKEFIICYPNPQGKQIPHAATMCLCCSSSASGVESGDYIKRNDKFPSK